MMAPSKLIFGVLAAALLLVTVAKADDVFYQKSTSANHWPQAYLGRWCGYSDDVFGSTGFWRPEKEYCEGDSSQHNLIIGEKELGISNTTCKYISVKSRFDPNTKSH